MQINVMNVSSTNSMTSGSQRAEGRRDSPDLQTTELQSHPITDLTGVILHVVTPHLSPRVHKRETEKTVPTCTTFTLHYKFIIFLLTYPLRKRSVP